MGVLSRDANGAEVGGHLTVAVADSGRVVVRLQPDADRDREALCSEAAIATQRWVHIAFAFGPGTAQLFVDGELQRGEGRANVFSAFNVACDRVEEGRIDRNEEPWVIGAGAWFSEPGSAEPVDMPLQHGRIDHLRFWRRAVDFEGAGL